MKKVVNIKELGEIVKKNRKSQGLTQEQLAAACGIGRRFIVELEGGKVTCHLGKAIQVLSALGIDLNVSNRKGDL